MTQTTPKSPPSRGLFSSLRKYPFAFGCFCVLVLLYLSAMFAGFLSPYNYDSEARNYSYSPPTRVYFTEDGEMTRPYIYDWNVHYNEYKQRIYEEDRTRRYPVRFFVEGEPYRLLGLIPTNRHLFGVPSEARIYLMGADSRGRDLFSRLIYGGRVSLSIGLIGVSISFFFGLLIGGISGYYSGIVDSILMRIVEMIMMVPGFYLLLALRSVVPPDFNSLQTYFAMVVILSLIGWASLARIIRGMCLSLRERDYVLAARTLGCSDLRIITRHILPHTLSYSISVIVLSIPGYILGESALSLIGMGIQDPFASWGNLLTDAMSIVKIKFYPWILWPGFFIFLTVLCFNGLGDALRDIYDPRLAGETDK